MKYGLVGFGLIGQKRFNALKKLNIDPLFIVDKKEKSNSLIYHSLEDVNEKLKESIDFAILSLPHHLIYDYFLSLKQYTKKILIEKPLGLNIAQAKEIQAISKKENINIYTGFNYRYLKNIVELKQLINEKTFGQIHEVDMRLEHGGRPGMETEWKLKKEYAGGGVAIDPGVHLFDLHHYLFGPLGKMEHKIVKKHFWESDVEDFLQCTFQNGSMTSKISVNLLSWKNNFEIRVYGRDATAILCGRGGNYGDLTLSVSSRWHWDNDGINFNKNYGNIDYSFNHETEDFISEEHKTISRLDDGIKALNIVSKIYEQT